MSYKWKSGQKTSLVTRKRKGKENTIFKSYAIRIPLPLWKKIEDAASYDDTLRSRVILTAIDRYLRT